MRRVLLVPLTVLLTCVSLGAAANPAAAKATSAMSAKPPTAQTTGKSKAVVMPAMPAASATPAKPAVVAAAPAKKTATARCRDARGKFVACASVKPKQCRDAKGKFVACPK